MRLAAWVRRAKDNDEIHMQIIVLKSTAIELRKEMEINKTVEILKAGENDVYLIKDFRVDINEINGWA